MSGVPNQGHFYCSESFLYPTWDIKERRCKGRGIDGGFIFTCPSRFKAYKLRNVLNKLYAFGMLLELDRFRSYCRSSPSFDAVLYYATLLLYCIREVRSDDSQAISVPIISNGG